MRTESHSPGVVGIWGLLCPRTSTLRQGFTLVEFIAVLAILAMIAALLFPSVIKRVDRAAWTKELADLGAISNALTLQIIRSKNIPDHTTWAQAVGKWVSRPVSQITTTPRGRTRAFLVDPNLSLPGFSLPYTQTNNAGLSSSPRNVRVLIVSSLARTNVPVASGVPSSGQFDAIWAALENAKPSTWTNWGGNGEDICIQRVNLEPLFHRLILVNRDTNGAARYSIDSVNTTAVPIAGQGLSAYFLDGSVIGLCDRYGVPMTRYVLTRDISFVFETGTWRGQIGGAINNNLLADNFADQASQFLQAAWYTGAHQGGNQPSALLAMYSFLFEYTMWANECPRFTWHNATSSSQVPEFELIDDIGRNNGRLDEFTGQNGLLK